MCAARVCVRGGGTVTGRQTVIKQSRMGELYTVNCKDVFCSVFSAVEMTQNALDVKSNSHLSVIHILNRWSHTHTPVFANSHSIMQSVGNREAIQVKSTINKTHDKMCQANVVVRQPTTYDTQIDRQRKLWIKGRSLCSSNQIELNWKSIFNQEFLMRKKLLRFYVEAAAVVGRDAVCVWKWHHCRCAQNAYQNGFVYVLSL